MSSNSDYRVLPKEPKYIEFVTVVDVTDQEKNSVQGLSDGTIGLLVLAAIVSVIGSTIIAYFLAYASVSPGRIVHFDDFVITGFLIGVVLAAILIASTYLVVKRRNLAKLGPMKLEKTNQSIKAANKIEEQRVSNEAQSLSSDLAQVYTTSTKLAIELRHHLDEVAQLLKNAELEYQSNAYGPFWDAIETSAKHLSVFNEKTGRLSRYADKYYVTLTGRRHTFPIFPVKKQNIPDASAVVKEFRRIIRLGQTNFEFANIWEHRRTRDVLIAGFRTLGEAVNNLAVVIETSIYTLQESISSEVAKVVEEEIKTRESIQNRMAEQSRMLDNLQHHRKPTISDQPTK